MFYYEEGDHQVDRSGVLPDADIHLDGHISHNFGDNFPPSTTRPRRENRLETRATRNGLSNRLITSSKSSLCLLQDKGMGVEEIVERILSSRRDITREELLKAIRTKTAASGGFLTEAAAARLVAAEHGMEMKPRRPLPKIRIHQLISGLNDVTVSGRVLHASTPREYVHKGGSGRMAKLLIGDETGVLTVVLWDEQVGSAGRVKPRQIVKMTHGYVRSSRDGGVELHVGRRGGIQLSPPDTSEDDFPQVEGFCRKIATLGSEAKRVVVEGVVQTVFPVSSFKRRDGTEGKVLRAAIEDDSGRVQAVFWNEKAETVANAH